MFSDHQAHSDRLPKFDLAAVHRARTILLEISGGELTATRAEAAVIVSAVDALTSILDGG